ncbi:hypothetical protein [Streptomyces sp. NPDC048445]|uniref:hypothetical protein n=1 Tax=Streptomyces sp. NPDC048445 TaxID=3365553 RepID=UPI00371A553D
MHRCPNGHPTRAAMVLAVTAAVAIAVPPAQAAPDTAPATAAAAQAPAGAPGPAHTKRVYPSSGGWGAAETISVPVTLRAGRNTLTFDSGASGYSPDIDRIDVPKRG